MGTKELTKKLKEFQNPLLKESFVPCTPPSAQPD